MIGRFALACLDMAGTTVRDDGAVEAAFTSALAAVGVTPGSRFYEEAEVVVHQTMGWSKADVFAELFDADEAREATAAFAAAYEAIVAAGDVTRGPRRRSGSCATCAAGGQGLPHHGIRALDPRRSAQCPGLARRDRPGALAGRRGPGPSRARPRSSAPWTVSAWPTRARWRWWATP